MIEYSQSPGIRILDGFLTAHECDRLLELVSKPSRKRYSVTNDVDSPQRISVSYGREIVNRLSFQHDEIPELETICEKAAALSGLPLVNAEPLTLHCSLSGEKDDACDGAFPEDSVNRAKANGGQRVSSLSVFLNAAAGAGRTFPALHLKVGAVQGRALLLGHVDASNNPHPLAVSVQQPPVDGQCWTMELNFRETRRAGQIPKFTAQGFKVDTIPNDLFEELSTYYQKHRKNAVTEESDAIGRYVLGDIVPSKIVPLTKALEDAVVVATMQKIQLWSGLDNVTFAACFGIREYQRGAILKGHRDREETHILSAILNVAQEVDEQWPLEIEDHGGRRHQIILSPGDMILYESARLLHGRETQLNGHSYANLFVHFRPQDWH